VLYYGVGTVSKRVTIGSLPDDVLLEMIDFYQAAIYEDESEFVWNWEKLVHVCRRWRYLNFESPNRLNLHLCCTQNTPVRMLLDVWPPFPLGVVLFNEHDWSEWAEDAEIISDNLVAALERRDRVSHIFIANSADFLWERIVTAMEESFPALRALHLDLIAEDNESNFPFPDTFLNGAAPCLEVLSLSGVAFPSLPRLLSSSSDLTFLKLLNIPKSGYISPVTMVKCLSALPMLESLEIHFKFPTPYPKRRNRPVPPSTRSVLPSLTAFNFQGVTEYLEVIAARIDAPLLDEFNVTFFHGSEAELFDIPQIIRFFGHLDSFRPSSLTLDLIPTGYSIFFSQKPMPSSESPHSWHIKCGSSRFDRKIYSVAQICSQILPFCSGVESLIITRCHGHVQTQI
jgi:hypothetical protein